MLVPTAMILADRSTKDHVRSARPHARTRLERPPRRHGDGVRRLAVAALRRLADSLEQRAARTT